MQDQEILIDLIARCALRDQQALKRLYEKVSPYLNRVAFNIVQSDELSNEVLQDVFVQVWTNAGQYQAHRAKPMTWLTSITRYRALDKLSKEQRHSEKRSDDIELDALQALQESPEDNVIQGQRHSDLFACLRTLSEKGRECIALAYLKGYSREDLASRFGTNVNTVKSWLHRGAKRLKECLEQKAQAA